MQPKNKSKMGRIIIQLLYPNYKEESLFNRIVGTALTVLYIKFFFLF